MRTSQCPGAAAAYHLHLRLRQTIRPTRRAFEQVRHLRCDIGKVCADRTSQIDPQQAEAERFGR